jgi:ATP-binding cassette subfamily B protein
MTRNVGQSTLMKLVHGLYTPTGGRLLVDGQPLADVPIQDWYDRGASLHQDFEHSSSRSARASVSATSRSSTSAAPWPRR